VSRGAAFGDIDNDGDVDIVMSNCNGPARLLLNQIGNSRHWLLVQLEGVKASRDAMGALVAVERRGRERVWRRSSTDGSYLSANDRRVHFGLGSDEDIEQAPVTAVVVAWPVGGRERWRVDQVDRLVTLRQGSGDPVP